MSKLNTIECITSSQGINLNKAASSCQLIGNTINLCREEIESLAWDTKLDEEEVTLFCLMHELGHAMQDKSLLYLYQFNPLPAEEDAWDRAEYLYISLWGIVPQSFYMLKAHCLNTYYVANNKLLVWS